MSVFVFAKIKLVTNDRKQITDARLEGKEMD